MSNMTDRAQQTTKPRYTWLNGQLTEWDQSRIHVNTDAVLRGSNVFEGIRAYKADAGDDLKIFRLTEHLDRMTQVSMRLLRMQLPWDQNELEQAVIETLRANQIHEDTHIRVVAYFGEGRDNGYTPDEIEAGAFILTIPRPQSPLAETGIRSTISSWRRISDTSMPPRAKSGANYLNSRLAATDAHVKGIGLPVLLNERGKVAEGPGQCIFIVRDGVLATPRCTDGILESITRATVLELAQQLGIPTAEREIDATELYVAEELFLAGTAAELLPIREIDGYTNEAPGDITRTLQHAYQGVVRGRDENYARWLTGVYAHA